MTPKSGDPMTVYIDRDKKLMVGVDVMMPTPSGREMVEVRVKSWKTVDGIVYPATAEVHTPTVAIEQSYDKIVHNAKIPASRFELPAAIQELVGAKKEPANDLGVEFRELAKRHVASVRLKVKPEHIGQTLAQVLPEVMAYLTELGISPPAPPFTRYYSMSADEVDMEAGFPVPEPIQGSGRVKPSTLPGGKVAEAWHYGHYNDISKTYNSVAAWLEKQPGVKLGGARWEVYWTDPGREPDPSKWRTQLFWTVK
jgi:effector-binding domain-containing protein